MKSDRTDVVILGAGIAGLMTALALRPLRVCLLTPFPLGQGCATGWAQGGIAAALAEEDSPQAHSEDTLAVAAGIAEPMAIELVTNDAPLAIEELTRLGVAFDRNEQGDLAFAREAAHSTNRILHCGGDQTGAQVMDALVAAVAAAPHIDVLEGHAATRLAAAKGKVCGVFAVAKEGEVMITAKATVLATGGLGHLYTKTTNPEAANGDGLAMAARAGAIIADPEFVQFHPTALDVDKDPLPLISEAVRGEGAWLINDRHERFMTDVHPLADLAPRDVVARAIWRQQHLGQKVFLDARARPGPGFHERFPQIHAKCRDNGIDPASDLIPVTPAAHYHMGGVLTDLQGRTSLKGLWACGEVASSGMHGANRLASNSLLEGAVFSRQVAKSIKTETLAIDEGSRALDRPLVSDAPTPQPQISRAIRKIMYDHVALERCAAGLREALLSLDELACGLSPSDQASTNMITTAQILTAAALLREESRGAHYRSDFQQTAKNGRRTLITLRDVEALIRTLATKAA
ncbi:MAG: L-aspartate oxidase [Alphaproteobacteria bacterium]|nr:MAG: L-aspartate oxidase [Alphaproteobacteria bacterium]